MLQWSKLRVQSVSSRSVYPISRLNDTDAEARYRSAVRAGGVPDEVPLFYQTCDVSTAIDDLLLPGGVKELTYPAQLSARYIIAHLSRLVYVKTTIGPPMTVACVLTYPPTAQVVLQELHSKLQALHLNSSCGHAGSQLVICNVNCTYFWPEQGLNKANAVALNGVWMHASLSTRCSPTGRIRVRCAQAYLSREGFDGWVVDVDGGSKHNTRADTLLKVLWYSRDFIDRAVDAEFVAQTELVMTPHRHA